jgi:hypothetical protein
LGLAVRRLRTFLAALTEADPRRLLSPFLIILCASALSSDSDNLIFSLWKDGLIPFAIVWFSSVRNEDPGFPPGELAA